MHTWQVCIQDSLYVHSLWAQAGKCRIRVESHATWQQEIYTDREGSCNAALTVVKYSLLWQDEINPSRKPIWPIFFCTLWFAIFILQLASFVFSPCVRWIFLTGMYNVCFPTSSFCFILLFMQYLNLFCLSCKFQNFTLTYSLFSSVPGLF